VVHDRVVERDVFDGKVDSMAAASEHAQLVSARRAAVETATPLSMHGIVAVTNASRYRLY
jgi:hypothetical protein